MQKCVKQVEEAWRVYYDAAMNLVDRGVYAEEQERDEARGLVTDESIAHENWFEGVEDVLTALEQAENPPAQVGLNAAQTLMGLETDIEASQVSVRQRLSDVDATVPATKHRLQVLSRMIENT